MPYRQPKWVHVPAVRSVGRGYEPTLEDVENHLPANHPYRMDRHVSWTHEGTHGINASVRNNNQSGLYNACYVLDNRAFMLPEPQIKLSQVARQIPKSLRGMSYKTYLVDQQRYWEDRPLYILDEWSAYLNGLTTAMDNDGGDGEASDVQQALEFMYYSLVLAKEVFELPRYEEGDELNVCIAWQAERTTKLYIQAKSTDLYNSDQQAYLDKLFTAHDAKPIRMFIQSAFGEDWVEQLFNGTDYGIL